MDSEKSDPRNNVGYDGSKDRINLGWGRSMVADECLKLCRADRIRLRKPAVTPNERKWEERMGVRND